MTEPRSRADGGIDRTLPAALIGPEPQNPAPLEQEGEIDEKRVRALADQIVSVFLNSLPSNYVSEVKGPYYVQQFQAAAEELARIQILVTDAYEDSDYDFTRSEVLFQFLATLVFPDAVTQGLPTIDGDISYREFLKRMVALLLQGSRLSSLSAGMELLTDAEVSVLERVRFIGKPGVAWTLKDQFTFEVDVSKHRRTSATEALSVLSHYHTVSVGTDGAGVTGEAIYGATGPAHTHTVTGFLVDEAHGEGQADHVHDLLSDFADLPLVLEKNAGMVLAALDPAHTLYQYRNLFRETFRHVFTDEIVQLDVDDYKYEDFRRDCAGFKSIDGTDGASLTDRYLFRDPTVSFRSIRPGAPFKILSGLNLGTYKVTRTQTFPYGDDPSNFYAYTTSPTGLSGNVRVVDGGLEDLSQNFGLAVPGEILTIATGPNAGPYLLETLVGNTGGPVGIPQGPLATIGPATSVIPAPSIIRVGKRFPVAATGQSYTVEVDRLGTQTVRTVTEDVSEQFYAPGGPYSAILTAQGPLIRRDGTPATYRDVTVLYDGSPITVASVNPFTGTVTLASPVVGFVPGAHTVTIAYQWTSEPVFGFTGLNNLGLTLNRWDMPGMHTAVSPTSGGLYGGFRTSRFRMGLGLGRFPRRKAPVKIAHRYIAFERGYTASLNSPTTLRLNRAPGWVTLPYATADVSDTTISYSGAGAPTTPWVAVGAVDGSGTPYVLTKTSTTEVAYWKQDLELPLSSTVSVAARLEVEPTALDGVFTGVGFGFHNNRRLFFAGALTVRNSVSGTSLNHLGILARPGNLSSADSWVIGPNAQGRIQGLPGSVVITVPSVSLPTLFAVGDRFQILTGNQTGVYTVEDIYQSGGTATLVVSTPFPADPRLWGNRDVTMLFEAKWDAGPCTWRIYANTRDNSMVVLFGGASGGTFSVGTTTLASPAYLGPDILPEGSGRLLWGNISRQATATSTWTLLRGLATPYGPERNSRGTVVDATMTVDPEDGDWYTLTPFGDSEVQSGVLSITGTPANESLGTVYGYGYTDPFLNGRRVTSFEGKVTVDRDTSGAGGAALRLRDTHREIRVGNLLYVTTGSTRSIYVNQTVSLVGSVGYVSQGWASVGSEEPAAVFNGPNILLSNTAQDWELSNTFESSVVDRRFVEFRLSIQSGTVGADSRIGLSVATAFGFTPYLVTLDFLDGGVVALRSTVSSGVVSSWAIGWDDGVARTYRLEFDGAITLFLSVDGNYVGTVGLFSFLTTSSKGVSIQAIPDTVSTFSATLSSLCLGDGIDGALTLDRTFGIWLGGDPSDINQWAIPRSDGTSAPNSDATTAVPIPMDWRFECWVRVFADPTFGATIIRPDLPAPPGYVGDFATQSMNPSAGWVTVEYARLPSLGVTEKFGSASFGKLNPNSSSIQRWSDVRYRVFTNTSDDYRPPTRMTLNRRNLITSGDYLKDTTPEEVIVSSITTTRVSLRPCGIFADRVFSVLVDGSLLPPTGWSFDRTTQDLVLTTPLPSRSYPVSVVFAPGQPVSLVYLQSQPFDESQTILNEGTPPVPMSQVGTATVTTLSGDGGPVPAFPPAVPSDPDWFLRDPYLVRTFEDDENLRYERMSFLQIDDGGSRGFLTSLCDGGGPVELALSGASFMESFAPSDALVTGRFRSPFLLSGGSLTVGGLLGPAVYTTPFSDPDVAPSGLEPSVLYPTGFSEGVVPGSSEGGPYREIFWVLELGAPTPLSETVDPPTDEVYASEGPAPLSPSFTLGNPNGTAWYQETFSAEYSRMGPWTGDPVDLALNSLLYGASALQPDGIPSSGTGFMLAGGSPLPDPSPPVVGLL